MSCSACAKRGLLNACRASNLVVSDASIRFFAASDCSRMDLRSAVSIAVACLPSASRSFRIRSRSFDSSGSKKSFCVGTPASAFVVRSRPGSSGSVSNRSWSSSSSDSLPTFSNSCGGSGASGLSKISTSCACESPRKMTEAQARRTKMIEGRTCCHAGLMQQV